MPFDGPDCALDPEMVGEMLIAMVSLADGGMTMICITHAMRFARQVADRVISRTKGEIVEEVPPDAFSGRQDTNGRARDEQTGPGSGNRFKDKSDASTKT
jgi:ABC-type polar amino acid transport system ATPase subunit